MTFLCVSEGFVSEDKTFLGLNLIKFLFHVFQDPFWDFDGRGNVAIRCRECKISKNKIEISFKGQIISLLDWKTEERKMFVAGLFIFDDSFLFFKGDFVKYMLFHLFFVIDFTDDYLKLHLVFAVFLLWMWILIKCCCLLSTFVLQLK